MPPASLAARARFVVHRGTGSWRFLPSASTITLYGRPFSQAISAPKKTRSSQASRTRGLSFRRHFSLSSSLVKGLPPPRTHRSILCPAVFSFTALYARKARARSARCSIPALMRPLLYLFTSRSSRKQRRMRRGAGRIPGNCGETSYIPCLSCTRTTRPARPRKGGRRWAGDRRGSGTCSTRLSADTAASGTVLGLVPYSGTALPYGGIRSDRGS